MIKPIQKISSDIQQIQVDIIEIKQIMRLITDYISKQEDSRKGWIW